MHQITCRIPYPVFSLGTLLMVVLHISAALITACGCMLVYHQAVGMALQGENLPAMAGPKAFIIRSADGSVFLPQPIPAFMQAELPGMQLYHTPLCVWRRVYLICNSD